MNINFFNEFFVSLDPASRTRKSKIQDSAVSKMELMSELQLGIIATFIKCPYLAFRLDAVCHLMNSCFEDRQVSFTEDEMEFVFAITSSFVEKYLSTAVSIDEAILRQLPQANPEEQMTDTIASIWMLNHRRANLLENSTDEVRARMMTVDSTYRRIRITDLDEHQLEMLTLCVICYNPTYKNYTYYSYILNLASDEDEFVTEEDIRIMVLLIIEVIATFDKINRHCINYVVHENFRQVKTCNHHSPAGLELLCPAALEWLLVAALEGHHTQSTLGTLTETLNEKISCCSNSMYTEDEVSIMCDQITSIIRLHLQYDL